MGKLGEILSHPDELLPLVRMWRAAQKVTQFPKNPDLALCYGILNDVSRSFAMVIQQLPSPLRDAVCVFYLILRGLDTVEDDMALDTSFKIPHLKSFHERIYDREFSMACGYKHYKRLMAHFGKVVNVFLSLETDQQHVIADITRRMGYGMAEFIEKEVVSVQDYDKYCHYVAGLVGIGLSQLFASSGLEAPTIGPQEDLANNLGLFLQKTNIIRDYLEDIMEEPAPRMFWPREVWGRYGSSLEDFQNPANRKQAVQCLNHMIKDALQHLPYCLQYMRQLQNVLVFRFCCIPQVMAAGTLSLCYNNGKVFEGVVKLRRGLTAKVFGNCDDMGDLCCWLIKFLELLRCKVTSQVAADDPTLADMQTVVATSLKLCHASLAEWRQSRPVPPDSAFAVVRDMTALALASSYFWFVWQLGGSGAESLPTVLQPYAWVLDQQEHVQRVMSVVLLVVVFAVVFRHRAHVIGGGQ